MSTNHPKHLKASAEASRGKSVRIQVMRTATAAVMAGLLAIPMPALAATEVSVGDTSYYEAASGEGAYGGTWGWDGANDMVLDNYYGESIGVVGELNIDLVGNNTIQTDAYEAVNMTGSADENLTISGEGTLSINAGAYGICSDNPDVVIDGATVNIDSANCSVHADNGDVVIKNGSNVTVDSGSYAGLHAGDDGVNGSVVISDSTVNATSEGCAIRSDGGVCSTLNITNSDVTAVGTEHAMWSEGGINLANSDINATVASEMSDGLMAQASEGASQGAAIASRGSIFLNDVNLVGARVATDEAGINYIVNADGGNASVAVKHTGVASKFVNGVGRDKSVAPQPSSPTGNPTGSPTGGSTRTPSTGGIANIGDGIAQAASIVMTRIASTGGDVARMVKEAAPGTYDATTFAPVIASLLAGIAFIVSGKTQKERVE